MDGEATRAVSLDLLVDDLRRHGYAGLCNPEEGCRCALAELMPDPVVCLFNEDYENPEPFNCKPYRTERGKSNA